ncbi:zinc-dependent alcohol dehydrogenase [Agrococcus carbonis]|uniref:Threonine 3-dehydrogenase n=1 Tax=Agrococcus carbonis TaxID=684552 RepID=A0A1H1PSA4_9MICO|nr:alcohol dehydrogenase catalytic domain-containing protein [Agrococcus carbonis]SDS14004.1 threonine 3-dehydrogenase [Agrococcus carbonis]
MRAVYKSGPVEGFDYRDDAPARGPVPAGHVRIAVAAASVCGTDNAIHKFSPAAQAFNLRLPVIVGHEGSGTVVEVGPGVNALAVGDRVAMDSHIPCLQCYQCSIGSPHICENMLLLGLHVDGLFAEEAIVPVSATFKLPGDFPLDEAALLEPAGVAMHGLQELGRSVLGKRVLVVGGGPVGLFAAELSRIGGAAKVVVVEPNAFRREFAESLGVSTLAPGEGVADALRAMSADRGGFDVAFEASGHPSGLVTILDALRVGGAVVTLGFSSTPHPLDVSEHLNRKAITMKGSFGRLLWQTWDDISVLIAEGRLELGKFITHRVGLSQIDEAIALLTQDSCKVLVVPELDA